MPSLPPRVCRCGAIVQARTRCACQVLADRQRNARAEARRPSSTARGYDSKWRKARLEFLAANPTCRYCAAPATVVDHIKPHRGDMKLFWSRSNWQPLCAHHHNSLKQSLERQP